MAYVDNFYKGQFTPMNPEYGKRVDYNMSFSSIGNATDGRTANQLKVVSGSLNTGSKVFEIAGGDVGVLESMPNEQFREINRLAKLTGSTATMHGPMLDPTGITDRGWDAEQQKHAERQIWSALERSHDLNPNGNTNFTIHATSVGIPSEFIEKDNNGNVSTRGVVLIDAFGKKVVPLKDTEKYFPTEKDPTAGKKNFDYSEQLVELNKTTWNESLNNVAYNLHLATTRMGDSSDQKKVYEEIAKSKPEELETFKDLQKQAKHITEHGSELGEVFLERSYNEIKDYWEIARKAAENSGDREKQATLKKYADELFPIVQQWKTKETDTDFMGKLSDKLQEGVKTMKDLNPEIYRPIKQFAIDKSSETVSNLALHAYKDFRDTAPIITLENHPAQTSLLTTGKDLANTIQAARDKFSQQAMKSSDEGGFGLSRKEADKQAEKLIGATWDVGHINMMKKYGFNDKDIVEQTEDVAKYVKHVHLSDNFGMEHTELPMGMGNVPIADIMKKLGDKGFEGKKIVEAFSWWQHFSEQGKFNPMVPTLQAFNSPVYGMNNATYWSGVSGAQGAYMSSPLAYLPEKHFQTYGTGFSSLPQELGGQIPGNNSRFTGTPNA